MKNEKLRPCPFCGGEANVIQIPDAPDDVRSGMWVVGCDGAFGSLCPGYLYKLTPFYTAQELAVMMWNMKSADYADLALIFAKKTQK